MRHTLVLFIAFCPLSLGHASSSAAPAFSRLEAVARQITAAARSESPEGVFSAASAPMDGAISRPNLSDSGEFLRVPETASRTAEGVQRSSSQDGADFRSSKQDVPSPAGTEEDDDSYFLTTGHIVRGAYGETYDLLQTPARTLWNDVPLVGKPLGVIVYILTAPFAFLAGAVTALVVYVTLSGS